MPSQKSVKRTQRTPTKICAICGDAAFGKNLGATACGSCKTFFRRTSRLCRQRLKCPYEDACVISADNRACKKCRWRRCVQEGMSLDGQRHHPAIDSGSDGGGGAYSNDALMHGDELAGDGSMNGGDGDGVGDDGLHGEGGVVALSPIAECSCVCTCPAQLSVEAFADRLQSRFESTHFTVTREEELMRAENWLKRPSLPAFCPLDRDSRVVVTGYDVTRMLVGVDNTLRRFVELSKQFAAFQRLSEHDKRVLLCRNLFSMIVLNARWDHVNDCLEPFASVDVHVNVPVQVVDNFNNQYNVVHPAKHFLRTMDPAMTSDWALMMMMLVIKLFETSPDDVLDDQAGIEAHCNAHKNMLRRHIIRNYDSSCRADYLFAVLMERLETVRDMESNVFQVSALCEDLEKPPLLAELMTGYVDNQFELKRENRRKMMLGLT